jgi:hypothetical protein
MDQLDTLCVLKEKFELDALQVSLMPTMSLEQSIEGDLKIYYRAKSHNFNLIKQSKFFFFYKC